MKTEKQKSILKLENFLQDATSLDTNSSAEVYTDEYFDLKSKYESMKKVNSKIYNYAVEKILKN